MKNVSFISMFLFISLNVNSQSVTDTLLIKTSAVCETCKKTIERSLSFEKGVMRANLDVGSGMLTLIYNQQKNSPENLRAAVQKIGYDADTLKANPESFKKLPECCRNRAFHK